MQRKGTGDQSQLEVVVTRLQPMRLPAQAARQLPDQSTTLGVDSSAICADIQVTLAPGRPKPPRALLVFGRNDAQTSVWRLECEMA